MSNNIEADADGVKPVSRGKLERLGDKLDATAGDGSDSWVPLYMEYEALATARALASKPPNMKIKTTADYWAADERWRTLWRRENAIKAEVDSGNLRVRTVADLKALLAVIQRDWRIVFAATEQYQAKKQKRKEFWAAERLKNQTVSRTVGRAIQAEIRRRATP